MVFLPRHAATRQACEETIAHFVAVEGQTLLGWRDVPVDSSVLGESIKPSEPVIRQVFIGRGANCPDVDAFERKLFVIRKQCHKAIRARGLPEGGAFYIASCSTRTVIYKGMVIAERLGRYYKDLGDERTESAIALVHQQRFSTNTFPSWELAPPFRYLAPHVEFYPLRGKINWMMARRHGMTLEGLGRPRPREAVAADRRRQFQISGDALVQLPRAARRRQGYSLPHALMMMIPEAWASNPLMDAERAAPSPRISCRADGAVGRPPPRSPSPERAARSARHSTATACAPRASSSPPTISW